MQEETKDEDSDTYYDSEDIKMTSIFQYDDFCKQFCTFLEDNQLTAHSIPKEKLCDIYKIWLISIAGITEFPSFARLFHNMKIREFFTFNNNGTVTFRNEITPQNEEPKSRRRRKKRTFKSNSNVTIVQYHCPVCNVILQSKDDYLNHKQDLKHKANSCKVLLELTRKKVNNKKTKLSVRCVDGDGDELMFSETEGITTLRTKCDMVENLKLIVENKEEKPVQFVLCEVLLYGIMCSLNDKEGVCNSKSSVMINAGGKYEIQANCKKTEPGEAKIPILLQFSMNGQLIHILRFLHLIVDNNLTAELRPVTPFVPPNKEVLEFSEKIIPGPKCGGFMYDNLEKERRLFQYPVSSSLKELAKNNMKSYLGIRKKEKKSLEHIKRILKGPMTPETHCERFTTLLSLEEIHREEDIRRYDMANVKMKIGNRKTNLLSLQVPGLAEGRPSIIRGDGVILQKIVDDVAYQGFVRDVRANEVWLEFHESFHAMYNSHDYCNVRFCVHRLPLRFQYRAVSLASKFMLDRFLFPDGRNTSDTTVSQLSLFDEDLEDNPQQVKAVEMIVSGCSGPNPYIVHGPPGTGKTVTLVEAMKQVAEYYPDCNILACAPSNSAADLMSQRLLLDFTADEVFRMYAMSRPSQTIPDDLQMASNYDKESDLMFGPSKDTLMQYKFVITTLTTAGRLVSANFPRSHFTHVFIDEAGHASEPEAMIAVAGILECGSKGNYGQLILAGDPKQLGPVIQSKLASKYGLDVPLMERLMLDNAVYKKNNNNEYDNRFITKLCKNYRSHPAILKVSNQLFYDNELQECAEHNVTYSLCRWSGLPKAGFPVVFHSVVSHEQREARSPSYFNTAEVSTVIQYVNDLLCACDVDVSPSDIGIISPYVQQVKKIREALLLYQGKIASETKLRGKSATDISVGSTEEFQGQERRVIIMSTVRSDPDFLQVDWKFRLGFLKNPKRFNVALTRAKALLIVIGNPYLLSLNDYWNTLIKHCYENGAMKGVPFSPDQDLELINQLQRCGIEEESSSSDDSSSDDGEGEWHVA